MSNLVLMKQVIKQLVSVYLHKKKGGGLFMNLELQEKCFKHSNKSKF